MRRSPVRAQRRHELHDACRRIGSMHLTVLDLVILVVHLLPLVVIYTCLWNSWQAWIGHEVWNLAYPIPRTRFILLGIAIPLSTAVKALVVAIWPLLVWVCKRAFAWASKFRVARASLDACGFGPASSNDYELAPMDENELYESDCDHSDDEEKAILPFQDNTDVESGNQDQATAPKVRSSWATRLVYYTSITVIGFAILASYNLGYETTRWRGVLRLAEWRPRKEGYGKGERIFIAANFFNNAAVLPNWTNQLARAIRYWGTDNVFVSIAESYSDDDTPALLRALHERLVAMNVEHRIIVKDTTIPRPPSMDTRMPRITFLSAARNRALEPLMDPKLRRDRVKAIRSDSHRSTEVTDAGTGLRLRDSEAEEMWYLHAQSHDTRGDGHGDSRQDGYFDRVLFSNDIFVEAEDFIELLETRDGDWDMVCSLDFQETGLYDAWVIRDSLGRVPSVITPFFASDAGMAEALAREPVPVQACWDGVAAFRADPLLPVELRRRGGNGTSSGERGAAPWHLSSEPLTDMPKSHPRHPANAHPNDPHSKFQSPADAAPLSFRVSSIDTGECFSSECFLFPYDLRRVFNMTSIWVNPRVVVTYKWQYYIWWRYVLGHWAVRAWIRYVEGWDWMWHGWGTEWHSLLRRSEPDAISQRAILESALARRGIDLGANPAAPPTVITRKSRLARRGDDAEEGWSGRTVTGREKAMWHARMIMGTGMFTWDGGECQPFDP